MPSSVELIAASVYMFASGSVLESLTQSPAVHIYIFASFPARGKPQWPPVHVNHRLYSLFDFIGILAVPEHSSSCSVRGTYSS